MSDTIRTFNDLGNDFERQVAEQRAGNTVLSGIKTGFRDIDTLIGGLQRRDLITIGSRPGAGKTDLAFNIACNVAKQDLPVTLFTLSMSEAQVYQRFLGIYAGVNPLHVRTAKESETTPYAVVDTANRQVRRLPITIFDQYRVLDHIWQAAMVTGLPELIVIDYVQLIEPDRHYENRHQELLSISRGLKVLAQKMNVPVIVTSQLSRALESRDSKVPVLTDLRDSGALEDDADVVLFVHRKVMYEPDTDQQHIAEIHIAKNRTARRIDMVPLYYKPESGQFKSLQPYRLPEGQQ